MKFLRKSIQIVLLCVSIPNAFAQLGFCNGNSGDPIFIETFGEGTNNVALPPGITTYTYANSAPNDGFYTVSSTTNWYGWHNTLDHTPNDTNGRSLIVNADFTAGEFFRQTINGLCENTSYEFSSWLLNLLPSSGCGGSGIPINVKFQIWDITDTNLLASGDTGNIAGTPNAIWEQFGLTFQTLPAQTSVILKMINNGVGGCGNDLAIDDIVFKTCGDNIVIEDSQSNATIMVCENDTPFATQLTANPDFSIYTTHAYQWQESTDNTIWVDIVGETNQSYITPNDTQSVSVTVPADVIVNWYDAPSGGNLLLSESDSYPTNVAGTYYAEAVTSNGNCVSNNRTAVSIVFYPVPVVVDEELTFCEGEDITLYANVQNMTYLWSTGDVISQTTVNTSGIYTVIVTNGNGCSATKTITLTQIDNPVIGSVESEGTDIIISTANTGDFEYSLDGINYQLNPVFNTIEGGLYTIYVRERSGCGVASIEYLHFWVPKFFTPNGDTENDTFNLKGIEFYNHSEVYIFDRYGRLLISSKNSPFAWDGTFKNQPLPMSDYWYVINIDGQELKGHFTLKR